jgi:hypothetical protein
LRTIIEEIWVLIVPRKSHRLCVAEIFFRGGKRRDYIIFYKAAGYCRAGFWCAKSFSHDHSSVKFDLRDKKDVDSLLQTLLEIDLKFLRVAME